MKTLIILLLISGSCFGQSDHLVRIYKQKPITDTCYVYIEARIKKKGENIEVWQRDLQTGERWFTLCPKDGYIPKQGEVKRILRSEMKFLYEN